VFNNKDLVLNLTFYFLLFTFYFLLFTFYFLLFSVMNIINQFTSLAENYLSGSGMNPVFPSADSIRQLHQLNEPLQEDPVSAEEVLNLLDSKGSPATVKSTGGRYFGFVFGGSVPAAMMAKLLATIWDQNAGLYLGSPVAAMLEEISSAWMTDILGLSKQTAVGFVTGATMANFTALVVARHELLKKAGWDAEAQGLFHAPEIIVMTGDEVHVSMLKALNLVGFGRERIIRVPVDGQGRIIPEKIPETKGPAILCLQAGNVNTGSFDPIEKICKNKKEDVWVHIDGAFGLWAAASAKTKHLVKGIELADSLATDAHKWLNVPYDCGLLFVKNREAMFSALSATAAYLPETSNRESFQFVPEMSREARGIPVWAALKSLGKKGLADLIDRNCASARQFAQGLNAAGYDVLNEVILNQVLVSFGDKETTLEVIKKIQDEGTCWCGGTTWQGKTAMRISVSSWATTERDVKLSLAAMLKAAAEVINDIKRKKS
jgi:glutamate/tyrosine decarboxylase-like PLP-dependent enzyme